MTQTETFTKVRAEPNDRDVDRFSMAGTNTVTEVRTEAPDEDRDAIGSTETRVAGEQQDVALTEAFWDSLL